MLRWKIAFTLLIIVVCLALPTTCLGGTLLVNQVSPYLGYGYGLSDWDSFSAALSAAYGPGNISVSTAAMDSLAALLGYDTLLVVPRQPGAGNALSATEISVLSSYIGTGRRVALVGENGAWSDWDTSILQAVGGTFGGEFDGNSVPVLAHPLTAGVSQVHFIFDGLAVGGTSLFAANVATLWGSGQSALTLLSVNAIEDNEWASLDNAVFGGNVAEWLAGEEGPAIPEPSTFVLFGTGALLVGIRRCVHRG
jgi:hypothetical protein